MPMFFSNATLLKFVLCFLLRASSFLIFLVPIILMRFLMSVFLTFNRSTSLNLFLFFFLQFFLFLPFFPFLLGLLSLPLELQITRVTINLRTNKEVGKAKKSKHHQFHRREHVNYNRVVYLDVVGASRHAKRYVSKNNQRNTTKKPS
ncbi:hypothetical protein Patl1_29134 [Pistacia atlantica]|uniref:Uncharacterized protein n=1 Tax=Pistacia atlantica TaxID=434234 RepID=A0ACC1BGJ5_9ROSI|nr:hypothetical protein Patl1_29134 [Pistacia atlantica]